MVICQVICYHVKTMHLSRDNCLHVILNNVIIYLYIVYTPVLLTGVAL